MNLASPKSQVTILWRQQQSPPGVVQTVVLDTASDVPWVQCAPCHRQADSTYDPARSGTYAAVPCGSPACDQLGRLYTGGCADGQCQ